MGGGSVVEESPQAPIAIAATIARSARTSVIARIAAKEGLLLLAEILLGGRIRAFSEDYTMLSIQWMGFGD